MAEPVNPAQNLNPWGEKIDTLRRAAGLTWTDLWLRVGLKDPSQGRKWVMAEGFNVPGHHRVAKIAEVLGVDPAEIAVIPKQPRPTTLARVAQLEKDVAALRETLDSLAALLPALRDDVRSLKEPPTPRRRSDKPR